MTSTGKAILGTAILATVLFGDLAILWGWVFVIVGFCFIADAAVSEKKRS